MAAPAGGDVVIAGAGIGGLATALFLARKGIASTILEKRTTLEEAGAGIQVSPNASHLLIELGLGPAFARQAVTPDRVVIRGARTGREIGSIALGPGMQARYGAPYWVLHRADLHTILLDAVRGSPLIRLLVGRGVVSATDTGTSAEIVIERSNATLETMQAALLIGADGVRSACRKALSDTRSPTYRQADAWRTTIPINDAPEQARRNETGLWLGSGIHVVHYPVSAGRLLNIVAIMAADAPLDDYGTPGDPVRIAERVKKLAPPLRDLIVRASAWSIWSLRDLPVTRMGSGRIALVGDAGHPVMPFLAQGGALAIEDGAVLADCLAASPQDVAAALKVYEQRRIGRVAAVQQAARRNGKVFHLPLPMSLARDFVIRRRGPEGMRDAYDWLYGWKA